MNQSLIAIGNAQLRGQSLYEVLLRQCAMAAC